MDRTDAPEPSAAPPEGFAALAEAVRSQPDADAPWDALEALAASAQQPDEVAALYRAMLGEVSVEAVDRLGRRAVAFHEEWFGENAPALAEALDRVLERDPRAEWAFQRLTVLYTVEERWPALLALYDRILAATTTDAARRVELLEEAAHAARDFARDGERAVAYYRELVALRPDDAGHLSALERLYERLDRKEDLLDLWTSRLDRLEPAAAAALRRELAERSLEWLGRPDLALDHVGPLLGVDGPEREAAVELVDGVASDEATTPEVRRRALGMLRAAFDDARRSDDAVRTLERTLALAPRAERPALLRELGERLAEADRPADAVEPYAELLALVPDAPDARVRLRELALGAERVPRLVRALEAAAEVAEGTAIRVSLRVEAADARHRLLGDLPGALDVYGAVLAEPDLPDRDALEVARRAADLLARLGDDDRAPERLVLLDRLARSEPDPHDRARALGELARVAAAHGDLDAALDAWDRRLALDPGDLEALDARVALLEEAGRPSDLVAALRARADGPVPPYRRRADLVAAAGLLADVLDDPAGAVDLWETVRAADGPDPEVVQGLGPLLDRLGRPEARAALLEAGARQAAGGVAAVWGDLGALYAGALEDPERALGFFEGTLRLEPGHEGALAGLRGLLDAEGALRGRAAEALAAAFGRLDRPEAIRGLLEVRLSTTADANRRVALLREAADLEERRLGDPAAALALVRRALVLRPEAVALSDELLRLGAATEDWEAVVAALDEAAAEAGAPDRAATLRLAASRLREERLGRPAEALDGFLAVLEAHPDRVDLAGDAARVALAAGRVDVAVAALDRHVAARGDLDGSLLADAWRWTDDFPALVAGLDAALAARDATGPRARALRAAAELVEARADDAATALRWTCAALALEPDRAALDGEIARLAERTGAWAVAAGGLAAAAGAASAAERAQALRLAESRLHEERLEQPGDALRGYLEVFAAAPHREDLARAVLRTALAVGDLDRAAEALDRHGRARGAVDPALLAEARRRTDDFPGLVARLEAALSDAPDPRRRVALLREAGALEDADGHPAAAFPFVARALALEPGSPAHEAELERLGRETGDLPGVAAALDAAAAAVDDPSRRLALIERVSRLREEDLGAPADALPGWRAAFDAAPHREDLARAVLRTALGVGDPAQAAEALDRHGQARGAVDPSLLAEARRGTDDFPALVERLEAPLRARDDRRRRVALLRAAAALELEDDAAAGIALAFLARALGLAPEDVGLQAEVEALGRRAGDLRAVVAALDAAAEATPDPSRRDALVERASAIRETDLDAPAEALPGWRAVFAGQPHRGDVARAVLRTALAADAPDVAAEAVHLHHRARGDVDADLLREARRRAGDFDDLVAALEAALADDRDPRPRIRLLHEVAALEEAGGRPEAALAAVARALELRPGSQELEAELLRLGGETGAWEQVVAALDRAVEAAAEAPRADHLKLEASRVREARLARPGEALDGYLDVLARRPEDVALAGDALRAAVVSGALDRAAGALRSHLLARGTLDPSLAAGLEEALATADATAGFAVALEAALEAPPALPRGAADPVDRWLVAWHEERGDLDAATAAWRRRLARDPHDLDVLREVVRLERRAPGPALVEALQAVAALVPDDLDALHEAARLARDVLEDEALAARTLAALHDRAASAWRAGREAPGALPPERCALESLEELVAADEARGDEAAALERLLDATRLPVDDATRRGFTARAAAIAARLGRDAQAYDLHRGLLADAERRGDEEAVAALLPPSVELATRLGRAADLLDLRRRELDRATDPETRLALRTELARLGAEVERATDRGALLLENLRDVPGHAPSLEGLRSFLGDRGRHRELAEVLDAQAAALVDAGDVDAALALLDEEAELAEGVLGDAEHTLVVRRRATELRPDRARLETLAGLLRARGEAHEAAAVLERVLVLVDDDAPAREATVLALGDALAEAADPETVRDRLERAVEAHPEDAAVRARLAASYREAERLEPLARLLMRGVELADEGEDVLPLAEEAASIFERLGMRREAVPALARAVALRPTDAALHRRFADALVAAERWEEAERELRRMIDGFGRRRTPERAAVHRDLAYVLRSRGDLGGALEQLEAASAMDGRNPAVLSLLAEVAEEIGDLDAAERALRALLLIVRRQQPEDADVGVAEALYGLHRVAARRGRDDEAGELLASAVDAASQSAVEARRLRDVLLRRGETEVALEVLDRRLGRLEAPAERVEAMVERAEVLDRGLGRTADALGACLDALTLVPDAWEVDDAARDYARRVGQVGRYAESLEVRAERARRPGDGPFASELLLRLGEVQERDLEALDAAHAAYERVEALGERVADAWLGLARVAAARGDAAGEREALARLLGDAAEDVPRRLRVDARYRLAELQLARADEVDAGVATLTRALEEERRPELATRILRHATHDAPTDDRLLEVYAPFARGAEDPEVLLDWLEKRSRRPDVTLPELQEGTELAVRLGELARADALCERAIAVATEGPGLDSALWAPTQLAERRRAAGDLDDAVAYLELAADGATDPDGSLAWRLEAGRLALDADRLDRAVAIFDALRVADPADRRFWEPELVALRRAGDEEGLVAVVTATLDALIDAEARNAVRLEHARFLVARPGREPEAAEVLRAALGEVPEDTEAAKMLADLFDRIGFDEDVVQLLADQLEAARDRGDLDEVRELSVRLGGLLGKVRRDEALDVYRRALETLPGDAEVARAMLDELGPDDDPRERLRVTEHLLAAAEGDAASRLAIELAEAWRALDDGAGERRALELGYRRVPASGDVRQRLRALYVEGEDLDALAGLHRAEGERLAADGDVAAAVGAFARAADIWRERLDDPAAAADALADAVAAAPTDRALLAELLRARRDAGQLAQAIADLGRALDAADTDPVDRVELLLQRARLHAEVGDEAARLADLEAAWDGDPQKAGTDLVAAHEERRLRARASGDVDEERDATERLLTLYAARAARDEARALLTEWVERDPEDVPSLRRLRELDADAEDWAALVRDDARLVRLETGGARVEAALALAESSERAGDPGAAREGLELAHGDAPGEPRLRDRLRRLYEATGAHAELAAILRRDADAASDDEARFILLRRVGALLLEDPDRSPDAVEPLEQAEALRPDDHETIVGLVDALISSRRFADAGRRLEAAIGAHTRRRSPELAELQARMARLAEVAGDRDLQLQWLQAALESDKNNGHVASELAGLAMAAGDHDVALEALRVVTLAKTEGAMTRAEAFLGQARIAQARGEHRRALLWARKARSEDPDLDAARAFLAELGEP